MSDVWVEIDENGRTLRIFKNHKAMVLALPYYEDGWTKCQSRAEAVRSIRHQVFEKQKGICLHCPQIILWESFHLHEQVPKGKGGEVSVENSIGLCSECHIGINGAHSNRLPKFTKRTMKVGEEN